jgi:hypothetical protein
MEPSCKWPLCPGNDGTELHVVFTLYTLSLKSMAQVHKSTPVAPSSPLRWQPYLGSEIHGPGTQVDSGRTFKPAPAATVPWV